MDQVEQSLSLDLDLKVVTLTRLAKVVVELIDISKKRPTLANLMALNETMIAIEDEAREAVAVTNAAVAALAAKPTPSMPVTQPTPPPHLMVVSKPN